MICRRQGRRCAQTAEETKQQILIAAGKMFCSEGYEKVSLRNISDAAGVSHSLIRHHFGSKEQIWYAVSDALNTYMQNYIEALIAEFPEDKPANVVLYHFTMKLLAHMLINPHPLQFIADAIRQEGEFFDYFIDNHGRFEAVTQKLVDQHNKQNPEHVVDLWELKWRMIYTAHAAISLKPLLNLIWEDQVKNEDEALLRHWSLYNKQIINDLNISTDEIIKPTHLRELLLSIACDFTDEKSCSDTIKRCS